MFFTPFKQKLQKEVECIEEKYRVLLEDVKSRYEMRIRALEKEV
jgi:hypothetical protein